ncbi:hypothetical protein BHE90_015352 [Fusarium euwallaceae]|uniref:Uncharacterized protein n=2 Tax=Fusarium solani species complex TaxID=232080 RepID=A0A3M2QYD7_9HYPO|nr:hypothetical protein CDV36_016184 [Fusarium kuroshium]RTE70258.1 hypothetical protein BHE90_015352 [Fusarium euwallaceae]
MNIQPFLDVVGAPSKSGGSSSGDATANVSSQRPMQLQTPPGSDSGSPRVKIEGIYSEPQEVTTYAEAHRLNSPRDNSPVRLPSLGEFDEGVEALIQKHGPVSPCTPPSPLSGLSGNPTVLQPLKSLNLSEPSWSFRDFHSEQLATDGYATRRGTITSLDQYTLALDHTRQSPQSNYGLYSSYSNSQGKVGGAPVAWNQPLQRQTGMDCYPSPPPEGENRHINQKYTTEEGDFIIYAWHDKKMKWQRIKQEFASRFGRTPERTVQGLQAWYYRMNLRIPIWDQDGWLCFDNEDDLEPRHVSIKCRERDSQDKPMEPLGLAQRYPERAVNYAWVDPELKLKARDWAAKRALQYRERRERRRRKEQRRLKL